jgi:Immunoglobulin I-set domain.
LTTSDFEPGVFSSLFADDLPVTILGRTQILEQGDLLIADVKNTDAGKYTCVRQNEAGRVEASAYLSVLGKFVFNSYDKRNCNC